MLVIFICTVANDVSMDGTSSYFSQKYDDLVERLQSLTSTLIDFTQLYCKVDLLLTIFKAF